jgi:hypothetical protein
MKVNHVLAVVLILVGAGNYTGASAQPASVANVLRCDQLTLARPRSGVAYKGSVQNSDYRFTARIPSQYTGWGAASNAPFHGFAVFLADNRQGVQQSCIVFEIQHRVLLPEDGNAGRGSTRTAEWKAQKVGNRDGFENIRAGSLSGVLSENITLRLELPRQDYTNDLTITLATPLSDRARTEPILRSFISSFRFW